MINSPGRRRRRPNGNDKSVARLFTSVDVWPRPRYRWTTSFTRLNISTPTDSSMLCSTNMTTRTRDNSCDLVRKSFSVGRDVSGVVDERVRYCDDYLISSGRADGRDVRLKKPRERSKRRNERREDGTSWEAAARRGCNGRGVSSMYNYSLVSLVCGVRDGCSRQPLLGRAVGMDVRGEGGDFVPYCARRNRLSAGAGDKQLFYNSCRRDALSMQMTV